MSGKRPMILAMICCHLLLGAVLWADASETGQPFAVLPEVQYEFKTVPDGTEIHHSFKIQNTGTAALNIEKVRTG